MRKTALICLSLILPSCIIRTTDSDPPSPPCAASVDAGPDAQSADSGIQHEDGDCFALSFGVYPQEYAWCKQEHPETPVPFACVVAPSPKACVPLYSNGWYPDRWCCCDPQASDACIFYK